MTNDAACAMECQIQSIRQRMKEAGDRGQVTLLAAVKYATVEQINQLHRCCGVNDIGENRVQQLLQHYEGLEDIDSYIGNTRKLWEVTAYQP